MVAKKRQSTIQPISLGNDIEAFTNTSAAEKQNEKEATSSTTKKNRVSTIKPPIFEEVDFISNNPENNIPEKQLSGTYLDSIRNPIPVGSLNLESDNNLIDHPLSRPLARDRKKLKPTIEIQDGVPVINLPEKKKRSKNEIDQHRETVISFRGIPPEIKKKVQKVADSLNCPIGIAARLLFSYGIEAYQKGELKLSPQISWTGLTLYPENGKKLGRPVNDDNSLRHRQISSRKKNPGNVISFRGISKKMHQKMVQIAKEIGDVPVGDIARKFLEYGISIYDKGGITLTTEELLLWFQKEE